MKTTHSLESEQFHPLFGVGEMVLFDFETTGLRPKEDEITQIAAARMSGMHMELGDSFSTYVDPGIPIPPKAQQLTRISQSMVEGAPKPIDALRQLSAFAGNATLFGHDIYRFDFRFIKKQMQLSGIPTRTVRFIDTMDIFQLLWSDFSRLEHGLDEIAARLNTGIADRRRHQADNDVQLLARVFYRIQTDPRIESLANLIPVHLGELPALSPDASLN